jgi:predicted site-specific integrase-resolvase
MHPNTLRKYANQGKIDYIKNEAGQRLYDVESYSKLRSDRVTIAYCRVSSNHQKPDLDRQKQYMREQFPEAEIISDVGSGLNYKRKGLLSILERAMRGDKLKVVVSHKDRLCRFGYELIDYQIRNTGGEIVVLNQKDKTYQQELTEDLLAILHVFSCRMHGRRSYSKVKEDSYLPKSEPEEIIEALVRSLKIRLQSDSSLSKAARNKGELEGDKNFYYPVSTRLGKRSTLSD